VTAAPQSANGLNDEIRLSNASRGPVISAHSPDPLAPIRRLVITIPQKRIVL
jgi:hypothetical protein